MTPKKKIWFLIFNIVQVLAAGFLFFGLLFAIFDELKYGGRMNNRQIIISFASFFLIWTSFYNLFLAVRYKKEVVQKDFSWPISILSLCFHGIITILIAGLMCFGAYYEFFDGTSSEDLTGKLMVFVVAAWAIMSGLIFIWQLQLVKKIKRTNDLKIESLIEAIGQETEVKL
jgi:hypothetical protein